MKITAIVFVLAPLVGRALIVWDEWRATRQPWRRFRRLTPQEEAAYRRWARQHYIPGSKIDPEWHPVVQAECARMNDELFTQEEE